MARRHISDKQVVEAYIECNKTKFTNERKYPYELLSELTGQPEKVCYRAMERAEDRGYIGSGVTLRSGWVTDKGMELLK